MDCEKVESALMDELYGELDELTSAATRRHLEGCARCAAVFSGLRATRRVATLPRIELPSGLEARILAAAGAAVPVVVPLRSRLARVVSSAGSWAMRPQTAMAAVFLVMIGTSVLLLRGKSSRAPASTYVTVTEEGSPAPATPASSQWVPVPAPEPESAPSSYAIAASHARSAAAAAPAGAWAQAPPQDPEDPGSGSGLHVRPAAKLAAAKSDDGSESPALNGLGRGAGAGGDVPLSSPVSVAAAPPMAQLAQPRRAQGPAPSPAPAEADLAPAAAGAAAAPPADPSDELWAARAARDAAARQGHACPSGPHFDDVASRTPGSQTGWDALYEGALCYESAGDYGSARTRFGTLLGVTSYVVRARAGIDRINKKQNGRGAATAAAPSAAPSASAPDADASH